MINSRKVPQTALSHKQELTVLSEAVDFVKNEFKCDIEVILADKSDEQKAKSSLPGKLAILIE